MSQRSVSNVAAQLNSAEWTQILSKLNPASQQEIVAQLTPYAGKVDDSYMQAVNQDPAAQFKMMMQMMLDMQTKLRDTMKELEAVKADGGGGGGGGGMSALDRNRARLKKGKKTCQQSR